MDVFWAIYGVIVFSFFIALIGRFVIDWVQVLARSWRPSGIVLVLAEAIYTVTDPPLKMFRRVIPPLRVGQIAIDFGFTITMLLCLVLLSVTRSFAG